MRRLATLVLPLLFTASCVSVEGLPDPKGQLKPGQRLVVAVYPAPGPWIIDGGDSKLESAAKVSPVGVLMQGFQDEHTLTVSKDLQQYLPRPHLGLEAHDPLVAALRRALSTSTVQTTLQAGLVPAQLVEWNRAKDQLDWRLRYYGPDPDAPAPRDYARALTLDDALILDVNVSFGTVASEDGRILPQMSAASRVYRGDTARLVWEHEDEVVDRVSSSTLAEFKLQPWELTRRWEALAPGLGAAVAASFIKAFGVAAPPPPPPAVSTASVGGFGPGGPGGRMLVPMSMFQNMPAPGLVSTGTIVVSTPTVVLSTPAVTVSTPAVTVSTQAP